MSYLKSLLNLGTQYEDPEQNSIVRVQNSFALTSIVFAIPFELYFGAEGFWNVVGFFIATQVVLLASLILNARGDIKASKIVIISIFSLALPVFSLIVGFESGFYVYYLLGPALVGTIFDFSQKGLFFASIVLIIISIGVCFYFGRAHPHSYVGISVDESVFFFRINLFVCFLILSYVTYNMVRHHYLTNGRLKESNSQLEKVIGEKEVLLAEVHHRVKNNLAVMSSLMNLQINQTENQQVQEMLTRNADRMKSMSMVHNYLYNQKNLDEIDFKEYLVNLTNDLVSSYSNDDKLISTQLQLESIKLSLTKAIPLGLVTNEIIVNSFKHAFGSKAEGEITIELKKLEDTIQLRIGDNGSGFDYELNHQTLGTILIKDLVDQIDGELKVRSSAEEGTLYSILISNH